MEILTMLLTISKWILLCMISFILWFIFKMVVKPWLTRRKYLKYPNCELSKQFHPFLGDLAIHLKNVKENKYIFKNYIESITQSNNIDIKLAFYGDLPKFHLFSLKAHKEFLDLFPHKVDRSDLSKLYIGKLSIGALTQMPTNDKSKLVRTEFLKAIGFNEISNRIPEIIEIFERFSNTWTEGEQINMTECVQDITFEVVNHLCFGNDAANIMKNCRYIQSDGSEILLEFGQCFRKILNDCLIHYICSKRLIFQPLADRNLIKPFKTDKKNIDNLDKVLAEFISKTQDKNSAYYKLINEKALDSDIVVLNIKSFLVAGTETSSRSICSVIYFLSKYPHCLDKLIQELKSCGILNINGSLKLLTKDTVNECDYLSYVVKEALRIDPPAVETIPYKSTQNVEICGIPIPKDSIIVFNQIARQYNPNEWNDPFIFLPERFDPTNLLFNKPNIDSKPRDSMSFAPFSFGMRSCPGQALAMLEIKIGTIILLSKFKFEIDKDLLNDEELRFAVCSNFELKCKNIQK